MWLTFQKKQHSSNVPYVWATAQRPIGCISRRYSTSFEVYWFLCLVSSMIYREEELLLLIQNLKKIIHFWFFTTAITM